MTLTSKLTGLPLAEDDEFASVDLGTNAATAYDRSLATRGLVVVPCTSVADRNAKFPQPGTSRPRVRIGAEEHRWDGRQWLIWDDKPRAFTPNWQAVDASDGSAYTLVIDTNRSGDGFIGGWWQRQGHFAEWSISVLRGDDTMRGGAGNYYRWSMPFAPYNANPDGWLPDDAGQTCVVRTPANGVNFGFAAWLSSAYVYCIMPNASGSDKSLGTSTFTWETGASIRLGGRTRMGGLL